MHSIAASSILVFMSVSSPTMAKENLVIPLVKSTNWDMHYTPDACQLLGVFGSDAQRVIFRLSREQPSSSFGLELIGQPLKSNGSGTSALIGTLIRQPRQYSGSDNSVWLQFGLNGMPFERYSSSMTISIAGKLLPMVRFSGLRFDETTVQIPSQTIDLVAPSQEVTPTQEAEVNAIIFKMDGEKQYRLETGSMASPMAAVRKCTDDLVKSWGYDLTTEGSLRRRATPVGNPAQWVRSADYPSTAVTQGHNGLVRFRLDLDTAGLPRGCHVLYRTNPDEFADLSCALLMQRARFSPAQDSTGTPVKSFYISDIRFKVAED